MPIKLNIGCGKDIKKGYINIDTRKTHSSVVVSDVRNLPYCTNSVDEIFAKDVYEHISYRASKEVLKYWVSLLKPNGILYIYTSCFIPVADLMSSCVNIQQIERAIQIIFGGQDYPENYHYTIGHPVLFQKYLEDAGITGEISFQMGIGNGYGMSVKAIK